MSNAVTLAKTISLRLSTTPENKKQLDKQFDIVKRECCSLSELSLLFIPKNTVRIDNTEINLDDHRKDIYKKYIGTSISFEYFSNILNFIGDSFSGQTGRALANPILNPQFDDLLNKEDYILLDQKNAFKVINSQYKDTKKKSKESNTTEEKIEKIENIAIILLTKCFNTLKKAKIYNPDTVPVNYQYIIVENIKRIYDSWMECDSMARKNYEEEERIINSKLNSINDNDKIQIQNFYEFIRKNNIVHKFSPKVRSYISDCLFPQLRKNIKDIDHFVIINKNGKQKKSKYSLNDTLVEYLKNNTELWQHENNIIEANFELLENMSIHDKHKNSARYPLCTELTYAKRIQFYLGDNYVKFQFKISGNSIDSRHINIANGNSNGLYIDGKLVNYIGIEFCKTKTDSIAGTICISKNRNGNVNPKSYFKNWKIWKLDHNKTTYLFQFDKCGRQVSMFVKEPSIVKSNGNKNEYVIRLTMTYPEQRYDDSTMSLNDIQNACWYMKTARPIQNTDKIRESNNKATDRFNTIKNKKIRGMGVDLGHTNPFAYSILEYQFSSDNDKNPWDNTKIIAQGLFNNMDSSIKNSYNNLIDDIRYSLHILNIGRRLNSMGGKYSIDEAILEFSEKDIVDGKVTYDLYNFINKVKLHFTNSIISRFGKHQEIYKTFTALSLVEIISQYVNTCAKKDSAIVRKDRGWLPRIIETYLSHQIGIFKTNRQFCNDPNKKLSSEFIWIKALEYYKKVGSSIQYFGMTNDERTHTENKFTYRFQDYLINCKTNSLKTIASKIVKIALDNNVHFICLENLNAAKMTKSKTKNENFLSQIWAPSKIKSAIKNAASWFGISVIDNVDETLTSQIYHKTGQFGYRDGEVFYYIEDNNIKTEHADINAAINICYRVISRYLNISQINLKTLIDRKDDIEDCNNDESGGKRIKAFLCHHFGTIKTAINFFKTNPKFFDQQTGKLIHNTYNNGKSYEQKYAYFDGKNWITRNDRDILENTIKEKLKIK